MNERDPGVIAASEHLVDPITRGDPESPLRWTSQTQSRKPSPQARACAAVCSAWAAVVHSHAT